MPGFVHLHNHTGYSLLDGSARIPDLVARARDCGMSALAITDHGVMHGVIDFYKECRKQDIKPIIGCELYMARASRFEKKPGADEKRSHLILLCKNRQGYQNLVRIVSSACTEGFYYKPRADRELLAEYREGLIATSACIAGEIPQLLLEGRPEEARAVARAYREIFGDDFYIEMQDHGLREEKEVNPGLIQLARELEIPLVCANDIHYVQRTDAASHDALLCVQTGTTVSAEERMRFSGEEYYLKTEEEMGELFSFVPEALENTRRIADSCDLTLEFGNLYLPSYDVPTGRTRNEYLRELCLRGLEERCGEITPERARRLDYELGVIEKMDYPGYFLIVWDMVNFARTNGIYVGPGRGSAAGSLVAYALYITDIDPLPYGLLFERFLNPERVTMPDIDTDFCYERRGEVIRYLTEKYGADRVAQIVTFGTLSARLAIRDVGRVLDVPLPLVDRVAKMVPEEASITIRRALEMNPELRTIYEEQAEIRRLLDTAQALEGLPRHTSTHAAGLVIAPGRIDDYLPILNGPEETIHATQYTMRAVEEMGLLKMDLLGLRTLTVIGKTIDNVQKTRGQRLDLERTDLFDERTRELLASGDTMSIFQLESAGMQTILRNLRPESFEDVVALVALYRPGPLGSGMVDEFIESKHGRMEARYLHPALEPILRETYGVILYQEQVMRIASDLAGFSMGEADLLRRAMGKKEKEIIEQQKARFLRGARDNGIDEFTARRVYERMAHFAGYGFNKSHSAAYALISLRTAYLKAHYPREYMAAMLSTVMQFSDKVTLYIGECRRMGIDILPPDLNESLGEFTPVENGIRFGLAAVRNVGRGAIEAIVEGRRDGPYKDLDDFCSRVDWEHLNRRMLESLILCGALDSFGLHRSQLVNMADQAVERAHRRQEERAVGQVSLFDGGLEESFPSRVPPIPEYPKSELLEMEKNTLGFYVSGHPLERYQALLDSPPLVPLSSVGRDLDGTVIWVGGIVAQLKRSVTRKSENMAYLTLEDLTGQLELLVFPRAYQEYGPRLAEDAVLLIRGRVNANEEETKLFVEEIHFDIPPDCRDATTLVGTPRERPVRRSPGNGAPGPQPENTEAGVLVICVPPGSGGWKENLRVTEGLLGRSRAGETEVRFRMGDGTVLRLREPKYLTPDLHGSLQSVWGKENILLDPKE